MELILNCSHFNMVSRILESTRVESEGENVLEKWGCRRSKLPVVGYNVFKYSRIARRSSSVSTSVNSWPVFDWLYMRVL